MSMYIYIYIHIYICILHTVYLCVHVIDKYALAPRTKMDLVVEDLTCKVRVYVPRVAHVLLFASWAS